MITPGPEQHGHSADGDVGDNTDPSSEAIDGDAHRAKLAVVDTHAHFLPEGAIDAAKHGGLWQGSRLTFPAQPSSSSNETYTEIQIAAPGYMAGPQERLSEMAQLGIDRQIVSLSPALYRYDMPEQLAVGAAREVNDELADWHRRWPGSYDGFAILPLQNVKASVAELERSINELGLVGAIVNTYVGSENWDSPSLFPVLEAAENLGATLFFHPAQQRIAAIAPKYQLRNLIGNPFETTVAIACLIFGGVLDRLPNLKLLFAHGGGFACADIGRLDHGYLARKEARQIARLMPSEYLRMMFVDSLVHNEATLRYVIEIMGHSQVVLGSDYPAQGGIDSPVEFINSCAGLSDRQRTGILHENVQRLISIHG